jgi:hypothetical protein
MPKLKYHYTTIPSTSRPLPTLQDVADAMGLSVNTLRQRFRMGAQCVTVDGVTVCRKRVIIPNDRSARWRERKCKEFGSVTKWRKSRQQDTDND